MADLTFFAVLPGEYGLLRVEGIRKLGVRADELRAGLIGVGNLELGMAIVAVLFLGRFLAGGLDRNGTASVHTQAPLGDVIVVGAPVGHLAAGVIVPPAEVVEAALRVVLDLRRLPEPEVPVQPLRRRARHERAAARVVADECGDPADPAY